MMCSILLGLAALLTSTLAGDDLEQAILRGDVQAVGALLDAGADPMAMGSLDRTAASLAVTTFEPRMVQVMADYGVDFTAVDVGGMNPLDYILACAEPGVRIASKLNDLGLVADDTLWESVFLSPAALRDPAITKLLIDAGYDPVGPDGGLIVIAYVAEHGHPGCVHQLVEAGAPVNEPAFPLLDAMRSEHPTLSMTFLLDGGADPNLLPVSPIMHAAMMDDAELVSLLLDAGYRHLETRPSGLAEAVIWGSAPITRMLLDAGGDPGETLRTGGTIAEMACRLGRPDLLAILLDAGATLDDPTNVLHGVLAGYLSEEPIGDVPAVVARLLELGADPDAPGRFIPTLVLDRARSVDGDMDDEITEEDVLTAWRRLKKDESFEFPRLTPLEYAVLLWELDPADVATDRDPSPIVRLLVEHGASVTSLARFRAQRRMDHWRDEVLEALAD